MKKKITSTSGKMTSSISFSAITILLLIAFSFYQCTNKRNSEDNQKPDDQGVKSTVKVTTFQAPVDTGFTEVTCKGKIESIGNDSIYSRGFCWDTIQNIRFKSNYSVNCDGPGLFFGKLNYLNPGTTYYAKAYAIEKKILFTEM